MGAGQSMEDHLFNLRYSASSLAKEAKKSEKNATANKLKCKKAMEQGNMEGARIYAESAIRDKNTALNYLRLSSRIDAVSQRVNTAVKMQSLTKDMSGIVKSMDSVMKTMNVEKITAVMDKFEQQFENLDLTTGVMEQSMVSSTAQSMPESQVENLMQQVADEHGLEFAGGLSSLPNGMNKLGQKITDDTKVVPKQGVVLAGGPAASSSKDNKDNKGDDNKPASNGGGGGGAAASSGNSSGGGGGGGGGAAVSSSSSSSHHAAAPASSPAAADDDEMSLEDRLKRLQQ